jgi:hypothetical protein
MRTRIIGQSIYDRNDASNRFPVQFVDILARPMCEDDWVVMKK